MHTVSIVIPTHNRCDALKRTLDALSNQDFPRPKMEVIVVLDGCEDGTRTMLQNYAAPFRLISIEQQQAGPAAARNHGAAIATGWLLIFLDDDVVPTPRWLTAHVNGHFGKADQVIIGYYPPAPHPELDYAAMTARAWWNDKFRDMQRPSHRFSYQDFLSGNCSMRSDLFASVGGFDHALPCAHEDYELGLRLLNAGATFIFSAEAEASHYMLDTSTGARMLRRVRLEAQADVLISSRHPELRPLLPYVWFAESRTRLSRCMHYLAFSMPGVGDALAGLLCLLLRSYQWLQLRGRWHRNHMRLINYCYLRGLADALGTREAFVSLVQDSAPSGTQEKEDLEMPIDLSLGLEQAIQQVDQMRPMGVCILFGNQFIGRIAPKPGHEPLRGIHLRAMLATDLIWPLFMAILQQTAFDIKPFPPIDKPSIVAMRGEA